MSQFGETTLNPGSGGGKLATSAFANASGSDVAIMPWSAIAYLAGGNASDGTAVFQTVDAANGLPVEVLGNVTIGGTVAVSAGSLPLPTGASTDATLAAMSAKLPAALGQHAMAASMSVAIASDQSAIPVSAASLPLPAGAAQDGTDGTGITQPAGGAGIRGWLSGIYKLLGGLLTFNLIDAAGANKASVSVAGAVKVDGSAVTQPVSGTVAVSNSGFAISGTVTVVDSVPLTVQVSDGTNTLGTSTHPVRTDPTGTTAQPVSGTVAISGTVPVSGTFWQATQPVSGTLTVNQGGAWTVGLSAGAQVEITDGINVLGTATHALRTDPTGTTTQPVSGTVTANAGTGTFAVSGTVNTNADGSVGGGAAASKSLLIGGVHNTAAPTLANGQQAAAQLDAAGNLMVNVAAGGASGGTSSSFGAAFPAAGTAAGASDGASMKPLLVDASGFLKVNVSAGSSGNAAASATGAAIPTDADYTGLNVAGDLRGQTGVSPALNVYAAQVDLTSLNGTSLGSTMPVSGTVMGSQGAAAALAGAWPVKVTDGTNVQPTGDSSARSIHTTLDNTSLAVTQSGVWSVGQSGTWTVATNADAAIGPGAAPAKSLVVAGVYNGTLPALSTGQTTGVQLDSQGRMLVTVANGSLVVTQSGTWVLAPNQSINLSQISGTVTSVSEGASDAGTQRVTIATDDGLSTDTQISGAAVLAINVAAAAIHVKRVEAFNNGASPVYLRIYNKATVPAATDTPVRRTMIPAGGGYVLDYPRARKFSAGFGYRVTAGSADNDATVLAAEQVFVNVDYE